MKIQFISTILLAFSAACSSDSTQQVSGNIEDGVSNTYYIGMSHDKDLHSFNPRCVNGLTHTLKQPLSHWNFKQVEDWNAEKLNLGFSSSFSYQMGIVNASAKAQFAHNLQDTDLTSTYLLSAEFISETIYFEEAQMTQEANDISKILGHSFFRERCGDGYINQIDRGGRLLAYVKFKFSDKSVKNNFKFSGSYGQAAVSVDASIDILSELQKKNSYAEIDIYLEGGNLSNFDQVLGDNSPVECKLENWDDCKKVIKNIIKYSSSTFPSDIADGHTRNLNFSTTAYPLEAFDISPEYLAARKDLAAEAGRQVKYQIQIKDILDLESEKLSASRREKLNVCKLEVEQNLEQLYDAIFECNATELGDLHCPNLEDIEQNSIDASVIQKENILTTGIKLGYGGGEPFKLSCKNFIKGVFGRYGALLDTVGASCDNGQLTDEVGRYQTKFFNSECPKGQVLTGFKGGLKKTRKHRAIGSLAIICKDVDELKMQVADVQTETIEIFNNTAADLVWNCPKGTAASALVGRAGGLIDQLTLECKSF